MRLGVVLGLLALLSLVATAAFPGVGIAAAGHDHASHLSAVHAAATDMAGMPQHRHVPKPLPDCCIGLACPMFSLVVPAVVSGMVAGHSIEASYAAPTWQHPVSAIRDTIFRPPIPTV